MTPEKDAITGRAVAAMLDPAVYAATQAGALIDMFNYRRALFLIGIGVGGITFTGTNKIDLSLQVGNASDGSDLVAITAADLLSADGLLATPITNGIIRTLQSAKAAADVMMLSYIGGKRYAKLTATFGGTHATGTALWAEAVLSEAELARVA